MLKILLHIYQDVITVLGCVMYTLM